MCRIQIKAVKSKFQPTESLLHLISIGEDEQPVRVYCCSLNLTQCQDAGFQWSCFASKAYNEFNCNQFVLLNYSDYQMGTLAMCLVSVRLNANGTDALQHVAQYHFYTTDYVIVHFIFNRRDSVH